MRARVLALLFVLLAPGGTQAIGGLQASPGADAGPVLVSLDTWPAPDSLNQQLATDGIEVRERFDAARTLLVVAPPATVAGLEHHPAVSGIYADEEIEPFLASSKKAAGVTERLVEANVTGDGVNVAIVDSGVAGQHPGLDDAIVGQYTVDDDGVHQGADEPSKHGSHVAGIVVSSGEGAPPQRGDVSGVAPGADLYSFDISSDFTTSNALRAFEWLYENHEEEDIKLAVNAWGRLREPATYDPDDPVLRASSALVADGMTLVFSAGNGGDEASHLTLEGTNPDVITVGGATDEGQVEAYSSRGPVYAPDGTEANWTKPDLVAPGSHVVSSQPDGEPGPLYIKMNGTSMAAPHAAGAAALLLGERPDLTPEQVKGLLVRGARDVGPTGIDDSSGAGMLDAESSLRILEDSEGSVERRSRSQSYGDDLTGPREAGALLSQANVDTDDSFRVQVPENGTRLEVRFTWNGDGDLETRFDDPSGQTVRTETFTGQGTVVVQDPGPGDWQVEVEPTEPTRGSYEANVTVTWLEPISGSTIPFSQQRTAQGTFPSSGGPLDPFSESWLPGVPNGAFMVAGTAMTVMMLVGRVKG